MDTYFGRTNDEWGLLIAEGERFLIERAKLGNVTTYTEMNAVLARRTGLRPFDFERQDERAAMAELLGRISERLLPSIGSLISALVHYLNENNAGPGFFALAQRHKLLPKDASAIVKERFWIAQVRAVHELYGTRQA